MDDEIQILSPEHLNVIVREAKKEDCPEIIKLIQELADYENMSDGPTLTSKSNWFINLRNCIVSLFIICILETGGYVTA